MKPTIPTIAAAFLTTIVGFGHARADGAPGSCDCAVTPAAPVAAPAPALSRWGVGLELVSLAVADPAAAMNAEPSQLGGAGVHIRYRIRPRWQLELAVAHVAEQTQDGVPGRQLDTGALSVLFHPRPHARWDFYLLAGLGARTDGDPDLTDDQREATKRGDAQLGVGVERRVGPVTLGAELRAIAVEPDDQPVDAARMTADEPAARDADGRFAIGATYYF